MKSRLFKKKVEGYIYFSNVKTFIETFSESGFKFLKSL